MRPLQTAPSIRFTTKPTPSLHPHRAMASFFSPFVPTVGSDGPLAGKTLVLPATSFGNVGQLACDLILNSVSTKKKCGYVHSKHVEACSYAYPFEKFGKDEAMEASLCLAQELYSIDDKVCVLQRRTLCFPDCTEAFSKETAAWVKSEGFKRVVLLAGADKGMGQGDSEVESFMNVCATSAALVSEAPLIEALKKTGCQQFHNTSTLAEFPDTISGAGISKEFFSECERNGVPLVVLVTFTYEGNNTSDGGNMAEMVKLNIESVGTAVASNPYGGTWRAPLSWKNIM